MYKKHGPSAETNPRLCALFAATNSAATAFKIRLDQAVVTEGPIALIGPHGSCSLDLAQHIHVSRRRPGSFLSLRSSVLTTSLDLRFVDSAKEGTLFVGDFQSVPAPARSKFLGRLNGAGANLLLGISLDESESVLAQIRDLSDVPYVAIPRFSELHTDALDIARAFFTSLGCSVDPEATSVLLTSSLKFSNGIEDFLDLLSVAAALSPGRVVRASNPALLDPSSAAVLFVDECRLSAEADPKVAELEARLLKVIEDFPKPFDLGINNRSLGGPKPPTLETLANALGLAHWSELSRFKSLIVESVHKRRKALLVPLLGSNNTNQIAKLLDVSYINIQQELNYHKLTACSTARAPRSPDKSDSVRHRAPPSTTPTIVFDDALKAKISGYLNSLGARILLTTSADLQRLNGPSTSPSKAQFRAAVCSGFDLGREIATRQRAYLADARERGLSLEAIAREVPTSSKNLSRVLTALGVALVDDVPAVLTSATLDLVLLAIASVAQPLRLTIASARSDSSPKLTASALALIANAGGLDPLSVAAICHNPENVALVHGRVFAAQKAAVLVLHDDGLIPSVAADKSGVTYLQFRSALALTDLTLESFGRKEGNAAHEETLSTLSRALGSMTAAQLFAIPVDPACKTISESALSSLSESVHPHSAVAARELTHALLPDAAIVAQMVRLARKAVIDLHLARGESCESILRTLRLTLRTYKLTLGEDDDW
ncbi:hypothetical protein HY990_03095 [Candidatus Micrarchaeota archaeon]|nr:hypothetical protein [Candidatus Micrarchaeota archaeon]